MKLVFAVIQKEDERKVTGDLGKKNISYTRLSSTGGFLRSGNTTLMVGVDDKKVDEVIETIKKGSKSRKQVVNYNIPFHGIDGIYTTYPSTVTVYDDSVSNGLSMAESSGLLEVVVGGAIIFVLNVDRFEKL